MTEIGFYHLTTTPLERALPKLLERVLAAGHRAVVLGGSEARIESLDTALWVYHPHSFLPHGRKADGRPEEQPIYLTTAEENPNRATVLVLLDGVDPGFVGAFERCLDIFDGNDPEAVDGARARWQARRAAGFDLAYWRQSGEGQWVRGP